MTKAKMIEMLNKMFDGYLMIDKMCLDTIITVDGKQVTLRDRLDEITDRKIDLLTAIDALERDNGWISVKDRLPEKEGAYIVYKTNITHLFVAIWNGKEWNSFINRSTLKHITHWMPLPTPPKEG